MAPSFVFPSTLQALEESDREDNCLYAHNYLDITLFSPSELDEFVKGVSFDLSDKELFCVEEQDVFDRIYSLIRGFNSLPPFCKFNLVESLRSNLSVLLPNVDSLTRASQGQDQDNDSLVLERLGSYRNAFKIYSFFLFTVVLAEENNINSSNNTKVMVSSRKKNIVNSWNWEPQRGRILNLIANSLEINLKLLFGSSGLEENFVPFIAKNAFSLFESAVVLKDFETKDALCRIVGACATKYGYMAQSCASIMHLVHKYDFVVVHISDAVAGAEKRYADGSLAVSLIGEIGRANPKDYVKDAAGAENVGRFMVELADRLPKLLATNVGVMIPHFGGDSYKIRSALVGVMGKLIVKAFKDVEGELNSKSVRLRTKQAMLEILLERCRDVSAYTRSRVLHVWAELCEEHSISIGLWNEIAEVAAGRLEDKSAMVRKSALNLLIMMLQHNPFGPQLRSTSFEATLEMYNKKLKEFEPDVPSENIINGPSDGDPCECEADVPEESVTQEQEESLTDSFLPQEKMDIDLKGSPVPDVGNLEQTRALVASLEAGLRFSKCIAAKMPTLVQLMASSSATDVENTIMLLMRCKQFQIDGSEECLRKMLPLVFSQDKSIYEAVENAFITIYIAKNPLETAKNILNLAIESNIGDLAALEFIVGVLVSKGDVTTSVITMLWDFFLFNVSGTTAEQSRGALSVLCMAAKSNPGVLSSHLQDIIDIGFGRWAKVEPLLARTACTALQRLSEDDKKKLMSGNTSRIFNILQSLVIDFWLPENIWYAAADRAIAAIYTIHPTPETIAADLVKKSLSFLSDCSRGEELQSNIDSDNPGVLTVVQVGKLSRYLFIVSHVAMNQLVYIESCLRRIHKQKARKETEGLASNGNGTTLGDTSKEDGISAELGLAASEDAILDTLWERGEKEIVSGGLNEKNLIGHCAPFLSKLCRNFSLMQKYPELQASAMLALCRFMIIDAHFCDANLQLLFTVVENAPSDTVRSNCTISLGDLAVRFPNLLEPWTENMYSRLQDPSVSVRKNAVLVLSHLILNDMMKVKGHIDEMAIRLEDEDERISNLARLFFHELSKKGSNPVYNLLPDMLGKLSSRNLQRESFCNIMQFLIGSIKKDKQMDALVEKLCNRFSGVTDVRQWEHISYCLSQITFTEKGMKKLMDLFRTYDHVLSEEPVMDHFKNIINKGKKFAKPELRTCIEEFEEKLNKSHLEKKEQELTARNALIHQLRLGCKEGFTMTRTSEEDREESDISEASEVINLSYEGEEGEVESMNDKPKFPYDSDENYGASSELAESVSVDGVTRTFKVRAKKGHFKDQCNGFLASTRRNLRSRHDSGI